MADLHNGVPFTFRNIQQGHRYTKNGTTIFPFSTSDGIPVDHELLTILSKKSGRTVIEYDLNCVVKNGFEVQPVEAKAMRLVSKHTSVPVPKVYSTNFTSSRNGAIEMSLIPGSTLEGKWDGLNRETKMALCRQIWNLISEIRTVPRPPELQKGPYQCDTNGFPTNDPLLADLDLKFPRPLMSDKEVRDRIYERYLHFGGRQYKDQLPNLLPQSESSVFTHADIAPRNIMVDERNFITGILDWGTAGWYPDYWEYAQISRPSIKCRDWPGLMERTAPRTWDLTGIHAARIILF